jgi:precorrin-2 dehydrogenase/sirohydrochlorin ferrochelatase
LRRGELAISISTGGASPTLARRLRAYLGNLFPPEWSGHIARVAALRQAMRETGAGMADVAKATDALIDGEGWLPPR